MTALPAEASLSAQTLGHHIRRTFALAVPVMFARAGLVVMMAVDTIMVGHTAGQELAFFSISLAPQMALLVTGTGLLIGTVVLVAQADGAGRPELAGRIWRLALLIATVLGTLFGLVLMAGEQILLLLGQQPEIAAGGGRVLAVFAPGMPAIMMYIATTSFLEGVGRPNAGMVIALGANLVNAGLNWVMIWGHFGFPAMGAEGAVLATTITRWAMAAVIIGYAVAMREHHRFGVRAPLAGHYHFVRKLLFVGAPLAVGTALETTAFSAMTIFTGWLGETPLAAYQVTLNVVTLCFMLTLGLSTATAVRVANAVGRGDRIGMARAGWVGTGLVVALMVVLGILVGSLRELIAAAYTTDTAVRALAVVALGIAAPMLVVDGLQGVLMGAVRGAADVIVPTTLHALSFWGITVPLGYLLAIELEHGMVGIMASLVVGLVTASLLLGGRFHVISRRHIRPV
jgi:MATE family multidrug resistance protein